MLVTDLRGMFLRGLDDGTNRDAGRVIGTYQGSANLRHNHPRTLDGRRTISEALNDDSYIDATCSLVNTSSLGASPASAIIEPVGAPYFLAIS
jgi:hypothetical protein